MISIRSAVFVKVVISFWRLLLTLLQFNASFVVKMFNANEHFYVSNYEYTVYKR